MFGNGWKEFMDYVSATSTPLRKTSWILAFLLSPIILMFALLPPDWTLIAMLGILILSFFGANLLEVFQIKVNWSSDKIRNLMLYKQVTKEDFTPQEVELVNNYFGKGHKQQIRDIATVRKFRSWARMIDVASIIVVVLSAIVTAYFYPVLHPPEEVVEEVVDQVAESLNEHLRLIPFA